MYRLKDVGDLSAMLAPAIPLPVKKQRTLLQTRSSIYTKIVYIIVSLSFSHPIALLIDTWVKAGCFFWKICSISSLEVNSALRHRQEKRVKSFCYSSISIRTGMRVDHSTVKSCDSKPLN